jgi:hypothetical protein
MLIVRVSCGLNKRTENLTEVFEIGYQKLLSDPKVDFAFVISQNSLHFGIERIKLIVFEFLAPREVPLCLI